jgi:dTDP-4-dehydrorhamnose reductase
VFLLCGRDPAEVTAVTTQAYAAGREVARRPQHSTLSLEKILATGFEPEDAMTALERYCSSGQRP